MKKLIALAIALLMAFSAMAADRAQTLKIYN